MSIGRTSLTQTAEAMRRIRNSARFMLGNIGEVDGRKKMKAVERKDMGLIDRFVMHELYMLERIALKGYEVYDFAKGMMNLSGG